jgi:TPR repeat protein
VQEFITFATRNRAAQTKGGRPWASQFGPPPAGAFGVTRTATAGGRVNVGQARTDSADAAAITDCFARRDDAACARAVPSLEAACAEKQTTSCVSLGSLYEGGFGVTRDRRRAAALYKTACGLGDKAGCARFAVLEAQGLGVPPNSARATSPCPKDAWASPRSCVKPASWSIAKGRRRSSRRPATRGPRKPARC